MKLYADLPGRRAAQVVADVLSVGWILACTNIGKAVHDATMGLRQPADGLASAGNQLEAGMTSAGDRIAQVPLVGDALKDPSGMPPAPVSRWPRSGPISAARSVAWP